MPPKPSAPPSSLGQTGSAPVPSTTEPLEVQVERIRASFELEKQRIATRGHWFGAMIGAVGTILVAGIGLAVRPDSGDSSSAKAAADLTSRITELNALVADTNRQLLSSQSAEQALTQKASNLEKSLSASKVRELELQKEVERLGKSATSEQTDLVVYTFVWEGSPEQCRLRARNAIDEMHFIPGYSTNKLDFYGTDGHYRVLVMCSTKQIVAVGVGEDKVTHIANRIRERLKV